MKLHLGVLDIPYSDQSYTKVPKGSKFRVGRAKKMKSDAPASSGMKSTGDVAEILEAKYHVFEVFYAVHGQEIADALAEGMADFLNDQAAGSGQNAPSFTAAESMAQVAFVKFIDSKEMDGIGVKDVPTEAARRGVNHRMLHPYAHRAPRPSFRDTGLYEDSARVWFEE